MNSKPNIELVYMTLAQIFERKYNVKISITSISKAKEVEKAS